MHSFADLWAAVGLSIEDSAELLGRTEEDLPDLLRGVAKPSPREMQVLRGLFATIRAKTATSVVPESMVLRELGINPCVVPRTTNVTLPKELRRASSETVPNFKHVRSGVRPIPHPIPYQGSKRNLAPLIAPFVPRAIDTWYEPFAGSAAMTLWAANAHIANRFVIGDSLVPMAQLWTAIIEEPSETIARYRAIWEGQQLAGQDYFNIVRSRYNEAHDPVDLLYLICRCVKNAVRFNKIGRFTQSADKRRLGMKPAKMAAAIEGASQLLRGKTEIRTGDWLETTRNATARDFVYLDPPYLGTSIGRDKRYAHQMQQDELVAGLKRLLKSKIRFALSYDGMTGEKVYGPPLPTALGLTQLHLHAGVSSQATLNGDTAETIESLYLSPGLAAPHTEIIRRDDRQPSLAL